MTSCKKWLLLWFGGFVPADQLFFWQLHGSSSWFSDSPNKPGHPDSTKTTPSIAYIACTYFLHACIWFSKRFLCVSSPWVSCMWRAQLCQPPPFWVSPYTSPTDLNGRTKGPAYTSVSSHLQVFHCTCVFSGEPETHTHTHTRDLICFPWQKA